MDVLVNNTSYLYYAPIETFSEEEVRGQIESIYIGPFRLLRAAVPYKSGAYTGANATTNCEFYFPFSSLFSVESRLYKQKLRRATLVIAKVLATEGALFNIRVLTVVLGTFQPNMGSAVVVAKNPVPADYKGSVSEQILEMISSGKFSPDGDTDKAMKAVYEVVMGEGAGKGRGGVSLLREGYYASA